MATKNVKGVKRADGNTYLYVDQAARTKIGTATLTTTAQDLSGAVNELKSGKADLDSGGKIPAAQLPSYVDDVLEYANKASFPATGESGKIYVDLATNKTYRWSGTAYVEISESIALGETSSTAYAGNKGKANADAIAVLNGTGAGSVSKAVSDAIGALDVSSVGGAGKYISAISEADGKISATAEAMDAVPTEGSSKAVTSGGIKTAIGNSVSLKTATGNPITLTDAANANAEELLMTIEPVQSGSGDPSPTNVRPIIGISEAVATRCGFNIWDEVWEVGRYDPSTGAPESTDNTIRCKSAIRVNSGSQIYFKFPAVAFTRMVIYFYDENDNFLSPRQILSYNQIITVPANARFLRFYVTEEYGTTYNNDICINVSDTNKDGQYEPYTGGATATITFGQTIYGGSVNFKTGQVTLTHKLTTVGALSWTTQVSSFANFMSTSLSSEIKKSNDKEVAKSDIYISTINSATNPTAYSIYGNSSGHLKVNDRRYSTVEDWLAVCSSAQVCYELETPITLTFTPAELELLKGNNTITANGAEISLSYYPDNAIGALAERVDNKADKEDVAVPKYDETNRREYYEGGSAFSGNIDSSPTAGSNNAVASGGVKTYVDNKNDSMKTYVDNKNDSMKTYVDDKNDNMETYVDDKNDSMKTYVDNKLAIKVKTFTPTTIAANGYAQYSDASLKNVAVVGFWVGGVLTYKIAITTVISDSSGLRIVIKNNDTVAITPSNISVHYI